MLAGNKHIILAQKIKKTSSRVDKNRHKSKGDQKLESGTRCVTRQPPGTLSHRAAGLRSQKIEFNDSKRLEAIFMRLLTIGDEIGRRPRSCRRQVRQDLSFGSPRIDIRRVYNDRFRFLTCFIHLNDV
ncbi:hypothetical protein E3N88_41057 [Mikania micrantha]|uniref:Uncharacterized protein n=1 Tax=Mikania micrantha TaxID=192012 RepID=A0A5N6LPB6_9ASTR|nr:hypothetical protein E3N88_41057 [Mikania micrantha]